MSEPPSRSPDSLTGASAEISALQLAERRGDGGTEAEREREREEWKGGRKGRRGGWKPDVGERKEIEEKGKSEEGGRRVQGTGIKGGLKQ